jgi:hypothetical protein
MTPLGDIRSLSPHGDMTDTPSEAPNVTCGVTSDAAEVRLLTTEVDRHWLTLGDQRPPSALCSCGEWQWDFDTGEGLDIGDHFAPFSGHVAAAIAAAMKDPQP